MDASIAEADVAEVEVEAVDVEADPLVAVGVVAEEEDVVADGEAAEAEVHPRSSLTPSSMKVFTSCKAKMMPSSPKVLLRVNQCTGKSELVLRKITPRSSTESGTLIDPKLGLLLLEVLT